MSGKLALRFRSPPPRNVNYKAMRLPETSRSLPRFLALAVTFNEKKPDPRSVIIRGRKNDDNGLAEFSLSLSLDESFALVRTRIEPSFLLPGY